MKVAYQTMQRRLMTLGIALAGAVVTWHSLHAPAASNDTPPVAGWTTAAPRDEIRPQFAFDAQGGPDGKGGFLIRADQREGLAGCWKKTFPVSGRQALSLRGAATRPRASPCRGAASLVELHWRDAKGKQVPLDEPAVTGYLQRRRSPMAETEFPATQANRQRRLDGGLRHLPGPVARRRRRSSSCTCTGPPAARCAGATSSLDRDAAAAAAQGAPGDGPLPPQGRQDAAGQLPAVRAAHRRGGQAEGRPRRARRDAHLRRPRQEVRTRSPSRSPARRTEYFGELAKKHNLYIVVGLFERDGHLVYNVAVLLGPDGTVIGKYRKVCLPRGEVEAGVAPGTSIRCSTRASARSA